MIGLQTSTLPTIALRRSVSLIRIHVVMVVRCCCSDLRAFSLYIYNIFDIAHYLPVSIQQIRTLLENQHATEVRFSRWGEKSRRWRGADLLARRGPARPFALPLNEDCTRSHQTATLPSNAGIRTCLANCSSTICTQWIPATVLCH